VNSRTQRSVTPWIAIRTHVLSVLDELDRIRSELEAQDEWASSSIVDADRPATLQAHSWLSESGSQPAFSDRCRTGGVTEGVEGRRPSRVHQSTPVAVLDPSGTSDLTKATKIAVGAYHTCALLADRSVDCWGYLGDNDQPGMMPGNSIPVAVSGITSATAISTGVDDTCALLAGGSVDCWGYNGDGQLGNGTTTASSIPVAVSVFPAIEPGAPTSVSAVAGDGQATVSWSAPASDGGSPIIGYTVTSSGGQTASVDGSTTTAIVLGLTAGTSYTFTVHATNSVGNSGESGASTSVTPFTAPGVPTSVSAVAGDGQATVSWSAPASDGGSPIIGYTATSSGGQTKSVDGSTTTAIVLGLTDNTSYTFTVHATNSVGNSEESGTSTSVTPQPNTQPGPGVTVAPTTATGVASPVNLTFGNVINQGTTSVSVIDSNAPGAPTPPNAGFAVSGVFYDIQTTAKIDYSLPQPIRVCISYPGAPAAPPTDLLHYDSTVPMPWVPPQPWVPIQDMPPNPADVAANQICGTTSSLSPFALATWSPPVLTVPSNKSASATGSTGAVVTYSATAVNSAGQPLAPICVPASGTTFPVGTTTVGCTATDTRGYKSSKSFPVTVGYGFGGFFQPLNDPISSTNPMSVFKGGSTITVKFALTYANGTQIPDSAAAAIATTCGATISLAQTAGNAPAVDEVVATTTATAGNCFRYDSTAHQFIFNLGTKGLPAPAQYTLSASIVGPDKTLLATHRLAIGLR
jgi:Fibronectin type III domain/HYR domain/Regulator of chromosome condensation (RCC1) repeat